MLLSAITWRGFDGTKKRTILAGVEELKRDKEQEKLEKGETVDEVKEWGEETEGKIDIVDNDKFLRGSSQRNNHSF